MPGPSSHPRRRQRSRHGQGRSSREDTPDADADANDALAQPPAQPAATASELVQQAQEATSELKSLLQSQAPWSKDAFAVRQRARNAYLCILFQHPLHPQAQSIEPLWIGTTYALISAYRDAVARIEGTLPASSSGAGAGAAGAGAGSGSARASKDTLAHLRTTLSRFRAALGKEAAFYHALVARVVAFHRLQDRTGPHLAQAHIPVAPREDSQDDPALAPRLGREETEKKVDIVYKGLICLGDLERYREQYSDKARKERGAGAEGAKAERFAKAVMYYEVARGLQPDNGTAFNQLAVIDGYLGDTFHCTYHYFRALEVRQPFPSGEANLERVLKKVFDKWRSQRHASAENGEPPAPESQEDADVFKRDLLTVVAILFIRAGTSHFNALCSAVAVRFAQLLRERKLLSETIVKTTAMAVGSHWQARLGANSSTADAERRHAVEGLALVLLLSVFTSLAVVAAEEAEEALAQLGGESALADDDEGAPLAPRISAVLRRLLPSLRIMSRWLKAHAEYVSRVAPASAEAQRAAAAFWQAYGRLVGALARVFPLPQLPELAHPLEEDHDMRGFLPLHVARVSERLAALDALQADREVHPNEEQLMRLADLLVDTQLLLQTDAGLRALAPASTQPAPGAGFAPPEAEAETQSVAETEDDPVALAMRASLGDGISVGAPSVDDDDDEVILWGRSTPVLPPVAPPTTAQGLLQSLTLNPSPSSTRPPSLLFGGMDGGGQTIWTMSREESQKGMARAQRASGQWDGAAAPGPPPPPGLSTSGLNSAGGLGSAGGLSGGLGSIGPVGGAQWEGGSRQASGQWDAPSRQSSGQWDARGWSRSGSRQASGQWDSAPSSARPSGQWDARPWADARPPPGLTPPGLTPGLTPPGLTPPGITPPGLSPGAPGAGAPPGFGQNWPQHAFAGAGLGAQLGARPGSGQGFHASALSHAPHAHAHAPGAPHFTGQAGHSGPAGSAPRAPPGLAPPGLPSWSPQPPQQGGNGGNGGNGGGAGAGIWGPPQTPSQARTSADNWTQAQFQQFGAQWYPPAPQQRRSPP